MQPTSRGFTLVELIVTMAILGLLMGILIPSLEGARLAAQRTQCLTNLRSLGISLQMYMDRENDWIFPLAPGFSRQRPNSGFERIYRVLEDYIDSPLPEKNAAGVFPRRQPFACPRDPTLAEQYGYSYDYFPGGFMTLPNKPHLVVRGADRKTTRLYEMGITHNILFIDALPDWHPGGPDFSANYVGHFNGRNAYYWDGSAGWVKLSNYHGPWPH